jgi:hypothetical protein
LTEQSTSAPNLPIKSDEGVWSFRSHPAQIREGADGAFRLWLDEQTRLRG